MFEIYWTAEAKANFTALKNDRSRIKQYKAVKKAILLLSQNPRHPGLQTHEYSSLTGPGGEKIFEAYAEQNTPAAYRIFWFYGPEKGAITLVAIIPHP
ncbi:MAG: hypothetical protein FWF18_01290 [Dehalococcoidia bacterium]|nr:hypothetical protein [Dehalococcoidia bacterium]